MKKLKKYLIYLSLPLVLSFLLFVHEPIVMYAANIGDFWFDFAILMKYSAVLFLGSFLFLSIVFAILKKFKLKKVLRITYISLFALFLIFYVHSNFLAGFLPGLNGETIDWNNGPATIVSIVACVAIIAGIVIATIKLKPAKMTRVSSYISLAVFAMLFVSAFSIITTKPVFRSKKDYAVATSKGINRLSNTENFLVLLLDAVDSRDFKSVIDNSDEYKEMLSDFTYYPDTMSAYGSTRESIPYLFSGELFKNDEPFYQYSTHAFSNSKILNKIHDDGYESYFFDNDFVLEDADIASKYGNLITGNLPKTHKIEFVKQESKFLLYRIMPYPLKRLSKIESLDFEKSRMQTSYEEARFDWRNNVYRNNYLSLENEYTDKKLFQFLHLEGGHAPFNQDENSNYLDKGYNSDDEEGYNLKLKGSANIIKVYLQRLKESGAYNNSTIVIVADHGYDVRDQSIHGRANPILFIKGKDENHHKMKVSNKQIYEGDLVDAFVELADGAKSTELFKDIPEEGRERIYMSYYFLSENHMTEYVQKNHAWDKDLLEETGNKYDQAERW